MGPQRQAFTFLENNSETVPEHPRKEERERRKGAQGLTDITNQFSLINREDHTAFNCIAEILFQSLLKKIIFQLASTLPTAAIFSIYQISQSKKSD